VLNVFGQRDVEADKGAGADRWLGTLHTQTFERHDLGVRRLPAQVLDDMEFAFNHFDHGAPPATGFLMNAIESVIVRVKKDSIVSKEDAICLSFRKCAT